MSDFRVTHRAVGGTLFSGNLLVESYLSRESDAVFPDLQQSAVFGFVGLYLMRQNQKSRISDGFI